MARMAASAPAPGSIIIIEEPTRDAAGDSARHDEPPAARELLDQERDRARHGPGGTAPRPAPERDQHGSEEDRHDEIDAVAARISDQRADQRARAGRDPPPPLEQ